MAPAQSGVHGVVGASWTTDAPFRETAQAIEAARTNGILAVEMEAAALHGGTDIADVSIASPTGHEATAREAKKHIDAAAVPGS